MFDQSIRLLALTSPYLLCRDRSAAARRCACYAIFSLRSFIRANSNSLLTALFINLIFVGNWRNAALRRVRFKGRVLSIVEGMKRPLQTWKIDQKQPESSNHFQPLVRSMYRIAKIDHRQNHISEDRECLWLKRGRFLRLDRMGSPLKNQHFEKRFSVW